MIFRNYVLENFPFLEDDFDALTDYELFCKMVEYMKESLKKIEGFQSEINAFTIKLNEFEHYFDNLDLQDEVDNKLDEMYENGQLQSLIEQFIDLQVTFCYNTVEDMCAATNFINGSKAKTYGFYQYNDGGGAYYNIRNSLNTDVIDNITLFAITSDDTLVAELIIEDEMSIKQFGAKGDGTYNDTDHIKACIENCKTVYIPSTENYYKINNTLTLQSGQKIYGNGEKSKILMVDDIDKKIFYLHEISDVIIENIKLCNENCQTGSSPDLTKNILIYADDVENLTIQNCYFENAYSRGIEVFKTKNFNYINNIFKNATFDMLLLLPECENVVVDNCTFDTIVSTYVNTYLFATGRNDTETYDFGFKNVIVKNSKFLNNPNWEGIDTHGGNGFYCENNYISNCKIGIATSYGNTAPVTSEPIKNDNYIIRDNYITNAPVSQTFGITAGSALVGEYFSKNIIIENNYIDGYGNGSNTGALHIYGTKYLRASNNIIINSKGSGLNLICILYGDILNNKIVETNSDYGIQYIAGCWFLNVRDNVIKNTSVTNLLYGVRTSLLNISQFENNDIVATNRYQSNGTIMSGTISGSTNQIGKKGNYAKNEYGIITYYCTDAVVRPAKTETLSSISLSGTASSKTVTGTNAMYYLTEGEEITLVGAGSGGVDLTTTIAEFINRDTFTVKDTILTTFTNQNPKTTAGTWTAV